MRKVAKKRKNASTVAEESYSYLDKTLGTISLVGEVTLKMASVFRQQLKTLERLKKHHVIVVEINSPGGDVEAGLLIADTIQGCTKPVTTRVTGIAKSMGGVILMAGSQREALPNSVIMFHQAAFEISATYEQLDGEIAYNKSLEQTCNELVDRQSGKEPGYWEKRCGGKNLYFNAAQALQENLIHTITTRKS
jgi:ATP-dependent Clp protease protease subunit